MRLISFDVGIKNMAFCIFDVSGSLTTLFNWGVLNLMEESTSSEEPRHTCSCMNPAKTKKQVATTCKCIAKYNKNNMFFCEKHAKKSDVYILPTKECSPTSMKKMRVDKLHEMYTKYKIPLPETRKNRAELIEHANTWFSNHCFDIIKSAEKKRAGEIDLIDIGRNLKTKIGELEGIDSITHVIIENQISPIANRMKTIQGMLAQYFIMEIENVFIEFISSSNKLSQLVRTYIPVGNVMVSKENLDHAQAKAKAETDDKNKYKKNKMDGINVCKHIIDHHEPFQPWKYMLDNKKRDDLADCFLQGIWYLRKMKYIE